jgi:hypothetical protein
MTIEKPQRSLQEKAAPLLRDVRVPVMPHRRKDGACWDIGDAPVVNNVNELFDAALTALGYEPEKKSIWKRDISRRTAR